MMWLETTGNVTCVKKKEIVTIVMVKESTAKLGETSGKGTPLLQKALVSYKDLVVFLEI